MQAISIKQPWAWLIVHGYKDVENRNWKIGRKPTCFGEYQNRGLELPSRIYVHAGKTGEFNKETFAWILQRLNGQQSTLFALQYQILDGVPHRFPLGAIIGEIDIIDCVKDSKSPWAEEGLYHFVLTNPIAYKEPIPYRGQLGFFEVNL